MSLRRSLGINGTRFSGALDEHVAGYIEVEVVHDAGRMPRLDGWADIGNLHVAEAHRRRGLATWLLGQMTDWLRLAHVDRVLDYAWPEQKDCTAFLEAVGFRKLTRTQRGWVRRRPQHS